MPCSAQKSSISWVSGDAADQRAGEAAPAHDQVEDGGRGVRRRRRADQHHGRRRASGAQVKASRLCGAATVLRIKSKLPACVAISSASLEITTSSAPSGGVLAPCPARW